MDKTHKLYNLINDYIEAEQIDNGTVLWVCQLITHEIMADVINFNNNQPEEGT
jgi:hypothetical protein